MAKDWWEESALESAAPKKESADEWWSGAKLENAPKRTWGEAIKDTGAQLAEGVNTTLGAIPSAIAPQSKAAGFFRDNAEHWRDQQSDVLKGRIAETDKRIQEAGKDGVMSQIGTAASEYWNDPAQAARLVATNLPSMAATLGTGAAAGFAAKGVAAARGLDAANKAALAAKYGTTTAAATNAALNAGGARGEAFEDLQKTALAQGMSPEQAEQAGVSGSILPGVVGGVAGAISGKIGLEKALLGQATTGAFMRKAAGAFGAELAGEQIEELAPKVATNYQVGQLDAARGLTDDVGRTIVETAIGSGPGAVVAGGAAGMRSGDQPPVDPVPVDPTTSPGAADPNAPQNPPATPPEAPDLTTTPGAGVQRDGLEFTREVDTSGLTLQDPAEMERARAATVDYQPGDATPQWDTQPGAAQSRQGLDMPAPEINTDGLGLDPIRQMVKQAADAGGALSAAAGVALDLGVTNAQFLGATGRDVQLRQTGPGITDESRVIDVDAREVPDQRGIPTARRLTNEQGGARATASQTLALPAPTSLREGLERIRAQREQAARTAQVPPTTGATSVPQASQTQQGSTQSTQAGGPQVGAATATASASPAGGNRVQAAWLTDGAPTQNPGAQAAPAAGAQAQAQGSAVEALRQQLRDVEDRILAAAPSAMGRGGGDIEAAMKSRKVPVTLKAQRKKLKEQLQQSQDSQQNQPQAQAQQAQAATENVAPEKSPVERALLHTKEFLSKFTERGDRVKQEKFTAAAEKKFGIERIAGYRGGFTVHVADRDDGNATVYLQAPSGNFFQGGVIPLAETAVYAGAAASPKEGIAKIRTEKQEQAQQPAQSQQAQAATEQQSAPGRQSTETAYTLPSGSIGDEWRDGQKRSPEHPDFTPTPRQQLLMDAVAKALDDGAFYNSDVDEHVAKALGVTPEQRARNSHNVDGGDFGYDVYGARKAVEAQRSNAKSREFANALNLKPGDALGTLIFNDGKVTTSVKVVSLNESGLIATITGKRGAATLNGEAGVDAIASAIDRAKERGKRSDGYAEFVESKVAPIDAAQQAPTATATVAQQQAAVSEPLPPTDIRMGDKVMVDGEMYTVTGPLKEGRKSVGVVADRDADTDPLMGVRQVFLRGDDAIRAKIAANSQSNEQATAAQQAQAATKNVAPQPAPKAAPRAAQNPAKASAKKKPSADQTRAKADLMSALADLGDILGKNTRMNIVPEQEQKLLPVLTRVLDAAFRLGYHKFKDSAKFALDQIREHLGADAADALTLDHLQGAYIAMAGGKQGADTKRAVIDVETKAEIEAHEAKTDDDAQEDAAAAPDAKTLTESLYQAIGAGNMPKDNPALKKLVEAFDGKPADPARMKQAQEELETAIAMSARDIVAKGQNDKATFDELLRLYESQPSLNIRTSTSVANQAYSTPAPLAFIASRLAGITRNTVAHEPTGGTGMLLIGADPKKALVNELNDLRISALKAQGFAPTQLDAATMRLVPDGVQPDAVVTNPPFGSIKDADGKPVKVKVDGYNIGQIDHLIAARALQSMKDDGKATLILGANKVAGGLSTDDRIFFNWLYSHYNVVGHFEVEGDLYNRQGAGWPVRVITINGRKKSSKFAPVAGTIQRADNWSQVYEQFTQSLDAAAKPATGEVGGGPAVAIEAPGAPGGRRPQGSTGSAGNVAGTSARVVPDRAKPAAEPVATVPDEQRLNAQSFVPQPQPGQSPSGAERPAKPAGNASLASPVAAAGNEFQTPYVPRSARKDEGVLIPSNMAQPTQDALNRLEDAVGDIDEFARKELGYESTEALHNALMGLQVDSVATAIYQIQQGKAAVIADQTGIGKGRQAASIIRWAARNGMTPVFVSVKPSLFTDMYGDLADIGTHDVAPFILNSTEWVSGADGEKLFANKPSTHRAAIQSIVDNAALPQGRNALFMTYSQINTANLQRQALMALAPNAVFVLDESHNAAGDSGTGDFMISVLKEARGVTYLSATYAKRPDNMPLYFKTDIGDAAADSEGLADAMAAGGLPLQTVVSNNLVKAGQMFRRERSYDGVSIASTFDTANRQLHERLSDEATEALRAIVSADKLFHSVFVKSMDKALKAEGSKVQDNAGNQVSAGVQHTEFSSVVHNFVRQMLLGLKAQTAADEAIASLKRGEKPIIAVENTMGSFLSEYAAQNNINQGDSLGAFDYRTVLSRALERSRVINVVLPTGDKSKQNIPLSELDPIIRKAYDQAQAVIDRLAIDIPVSPIDWMRAEIARAGFSVAEITGRDLAVDYSNPRKPVLSAIDLTEQRDKVASTRRFNGGELDALILNVAGSTGISLHASEKFADQRQRHMIVAQAAGDINIFMQMLGRVHRTGQVRLPKYTILSVDLPTEKRPTAVLSRKMKSLNANTSSNTESATSVKTADILNKYGDQIVNQYLVDNLELARQLGVDDLLSSDGERVADDIARKATGRLALQPIEVQRAFYEDVEAQYDALIEYLNKTNQNDLEPRTFDFDAKELRTEILFDGPNKTTPFGEDAVYGEYSIKAQGVAMKPEEIQAAIAENLQGKTGAEHAQDLLNGLLQTYVEQTNAALAQKAGQGAAFDLDQYAAFLKPLFGEDGAARMTAQAQAAISTGTPVAQITARDLSGAQGVEAGAEFLRNHAIGKTFRVEINSEPYNAVITNVRNTHKTTGNPFSLSKFQITLAVNGALRSITVPATQFRKIEVSSIAPAFRIETLFKEQPANQRETAKIVTGNLLAAYGELKGVRGTIISFTKSDGTIEQGILLPKLFDFSKNTQGDYRLRSGADALKFLQQSTNKDIGRFGIATRDGQVRVLPRGDGVQVRVPKSKAQGARYFLDKNLIAAAGDFVSSANAMVANVDDAASAEKVLDMLMDKQALYALPSMADEAKSMASKPEPDGGAASFSRAPAAAPSRADSNARNVATQMLVDGLKAKWTRAPEIIVARNMQDAQIPQAVRDYDLELKSQGATGEARGFIYKGKVYLLSDELKGPQQIAEVLFHEVLGHYGLRGAFGDSLNSILQQMGTMRRRDVVAKAREYGLFDKDALGGLDKATASDSQIWAAMSAKDRLSAAEEVLAEMAQTQPTIGFVQRAIAAIRNWLRANVPGFDKLALTDADIVQAYILPARGYVTRSNETAQQAIDRAMLAFSRAYHGTPHRGIEKFSTDKIGTGEGAQAYGWGLYFASKREIADHYRRKLSGDGAMLDGIPMSRMPWYYANLVDDIRNGKDFYQSKAVAISIAQELLQREQRDLAAGKRWAKQAYVAELEGHVAALQRMTEDSYEERENFGQLYEVEIPEDSEMLLWDRPLSEQPEKARKALESRNLLSSRMTGEQLYKHLKANPSHFDGLLSGSALTQAHIYPDQGASMFLSALGIKGIKYLDGDSRNAGEGSYNYVIFTGDDVQIERAHFSRTPGDQTQTENFRRWFAGSKAVDADGKPLRVYHGTSGDFSSFATDLVNYFSADASAASVYAEGFGKPRKGANVLPVYLSIKNPKWMPLTDSAKLTAGDLAALKADGFDGVFGWVLDTGMGSVTPIAREVGTGQRGMDKIVTEAIPLHPEQVKSAIGNNGNFDPSNPDIRFSRATEAAKAAGDAIKSVTVTNIKKKAGFKLTDYLGIGLQALGRRQIVDIYGDTLPLAEYTKLVTQMEADKNEGSAEADQLVTRWADLPDEGKLADLMHEATLAQIDPAKPYVGGDDKAKYAMLAGRFNALSQEAKKVYTDTRDAYQAHHAKVRSAIKERIERSEIKGERKAALLKQMDDEFFKAIKGVYFPLARFGQYAVTVKGPDGKVESVSRAETKAEAEALRNNLLSAFPRDKGFTVGRVMLSKDFIADRDAVGRGFMTELYQVLDKQDMDAAQRAELEDTLGQLYLSSLPDLSWAKHGIHRKGTPGFSQDARRAFAQNMFHGARYLAKLRYSDLMQDELTAMQKHVDDWREVEDFDQNSAQRVVDEMNKRHESLMNPKSNPLSTALTSLGFVFHLGLSPASAMVNLSQTALVAYPIMGAKWGFNKASAALLKASKQAAAGKNDITGSLNADERAAYDEAVRAGTIDVTMAHDLAGIAQGEDAGVMWKIRPVMRWASFLFHHAERFNRQVTFVAAYRLARETGADHKAAFEQATKATYDGHFDYGAANRPRVMQGNVAKVLLLFKQYGQNMVYTLSRSAYQSIKGTDAEKSEARKVLAGLLTSHAMAAGVLGLPMVTTLLAAASMIGGDDDEPWDAKVALQNLLADTFGQKPAEVLAHGLSRLTPWDISGRVGLDRLIFPDVQEGLEGQRLAESAMAAALGPVAGIGINVLKGMQMMGEGRYAMGLEAMMPAALRGPVKALRYAEEGVQDKSGISILDQVSPAAVAGQALGFSPSAARNAQEGKSAILAHDRALGERRQELLTKIARATMAKDEEAKAEAREEIRRFNEKNPGRRINPNHIMASVRGRQKRIDQAQDGVYLPRNRREAMEAGRFATSE